MTGLVVLLGQNICRARKEKGLSQEKLARMCNVDRSYMKHIERGEVNITVQKAYQLAKILQIDPKKVFS